MTVLHVFCIACCGVVAASLCLFKMRRSRQYSELSISSSDKISDLSSAHAHKFEDINVSMKVTSNSKSEDWRNVPIPKFSLGDVASSVHSSEFGKVTVSSTTTRTFNLISVKREMHGASPGHGAHAWHRYGRDDDGHGDDAVLCRL